MIVRRVDDAAGDEMWSFGGKQPEQRWPWQASDHWTGPVVAYVFGRRTEEVLLQLNARLAPWGDPALPHGLWGGVRATSGAGSPQPGPRESAAH